MRLTNALGSIGIDSGRIRDDTRFARPTRNRQMVAGIRITSFARTARDPILPLLILGVVGVALFASVILKASDDIVFGIVFIGCLTAFLEIKLRNDNRE